MRLSRRRLNRTLLHRQHLLTRTDAPPESSELDDEVARLETMLGTRMAS